MLLGDKDERVAHSCLLQPVDGRQNNYISIQASVHASFG